MAKKGQKFETYSFELKQKAIQMRLQGMTKQRVAEELKIIDIDRLKIWMRQYRLKGEFGLMDQRGRRKEYVDQERYVKKLELENSVLKKWLEITKQEVYQSNFGLSQSYVTTIPSKSSAKSLTYLEADSTPI